MLLIDLGCRMQLKNAGNYVVAMVTFVAVGYQSYLQFTSLPVHMKETTLFYFYRYVKKNCYFFSSSFFSPFNLHLNTGTELGFEVGRGAKYKHKKVYENQN